MSPPANQHIFCCSTAKIAKETIDPSSTSGSKLLEFVTSVVDGKLPCRPNFGFVMEDEDVGDILFAVNTTESAIAHSGSEFFCNFHVAGPDSDPSILVVKLPTEVLREDFELDKECAVYVRCEEHSSSWVIVKVLKRRVKEENPDSEQISDSNQMSDPIRVSDADQMSDPDQTSVPNEMSNPGRTSDPNHTSDTDQMSHADEMSDLKKIPDRGRKFVREWLS
ncbi:hypothetical protein DL98DRAFT_605649 [Cadophora sp. DSE1049]|nr:hypothetical protein DL98DRAFT_605649 [Cadophora sp. DSE1049]